MQYAYYVLTFVFGVTFGSFFNVIADRLIKGESFTKGRSHCDGCKKELTTKNLIPLLSFILQRGKCDSCGMKLSGYYIFSELFTGLLFVLAAYISRVTEVPTLSNGLGFLFLLMVFSLYVILFLTDIKYYILPNKIVFLGVISTLLILIISNVTEILNLKSALESDVMGKYLIEAGYLNNQIQLMLREFGMRIASSIGIALFFLTLVFITRGRGMGGGDIKLGLFIGLVNGFPYNTLAIFLGFVLGSIYSVCLIFIKRKTLKDTIPFGPFLIMGSILSLLWGDWIISWYIHLF